MSEEQQTVLLEPQNKWSRKKIVLVILAAFLLAGALLFQLAAGKVRTAVEQSLLVSANEAVNGRILVDGIDLSILGSVSASDVQVLDAAGEPLARIKRVHISYNWSDLLKGQVGPQLIKAVTVEKPELWVAYRQDRLNWDSLFKATTNDQSDVAWLVRVEDGKLHLATDFFNKTVDQLAGEIDFRQQDQVRLTAAGKVDQAALQLDGQWGTPASAEITVSAAGMDLTTLGLTAADDPIQVAGGSLDELIVKIGQDAATGAALLKTLSGRFSGLATTGALALTQGSAQFEKQADTIQVANGQALYQGQAITAAGQVLTASSGDKLLDFDVRLPAGDPAVLLPGLQAGGVLAAQGKVSGSAFSPVLSGSFTLGSLQFGNIIISGINGTFSYAQQIIKLLAAQGATLGGSVTAGGEITPATEQFTLSLAGSGLDSSQLTEKDVKGPLSFTGTATGSAAAATVQGRFAIDNGTAYGLTFRTLTGNFLKQGAAEAQISNLAIETDFGVFYPEQLNQNLVEKLRERNLPATREEIKEKVTEKLFEKIFR